MKKEVWKDIDGYNGWYQVSNMGHIRSWRPINQFTSALEKPKLLKISIRDGYERLSLNDDNGKRSNYLVHRLVADAFIPNPENKPHVNHIDFNRQNNCVDNLEWVTAKENFRHSMDAGRTNFSGLGSPGEDHFNATLTNNDVLDIRNAFNLGFSRKELSDAFDVPYRRMCKIISNEIWREI